MSSSATIHFSGPGIDRHVTLPDNGSELTVGRDPAADVHLPDPEKAISRKHLALRLAGGAIEFRVVSSINGVVSSRGDVAPGATGLLAVGESLVLGSYTLFVVAAPAPGVASGVESGEAPGLASGVASLAAEAVPAANAADPWAGLSSPWAQVSAPASAPAAAGVSISVSVPAMPAIPVIPAIALTPPAPPPSAPAAPPAVADDDPFASLEQAFGDDPFSAWTSSYTGTGPYAATPPAAPSPATSPSFSAPVPPQFAIASPVSASPSSSPAPALPPVQPNGTSPAPAGPDARIAALFEGLGLPVPNDFQAADAQHVGATVRLIVEGLADLLGARAALKRELRADDRTMLNARGNNPLKLGLTAEQVLQFLFASGGAAGAAYMAPDQAIRETVTDLRAHEIATIAASRAAVQGAIQDFEPSRLKAKLTQGKPKKLPQFLDNARLWDLYQQHYHEQQQQMADWLDRLFDRHFMPVYSKESERLRAAMDGASGEPDLPSAGG